VTDATEEEGNNLWDRLRRRKVVQWGIAYAAGAWGLLQVLQFLADTYDWPVQVLRLVTLAFAIGLPIALTLAWYHGDRGHQKPVRAELAIVALLRCRLHRSLLTGLSLRFIPHSGRSAPSCRKSSAPRNPAQERESK